MTKFYLASTSPRRQELLEKLGLVYEVIPGSYQEMYRGEDPINYVEKNALNKALSIKDKVTEGIIIGADTIVYLDSVMGKPKDPDDAVKMLNTLSGKEHFVFTGVAVIDMLSGRKIVRSEKTIVRFRQLLDDEILAYVRSGEPLDKAGSYGIQGKGALLVKEIQGCFFNVMGLPLVLLYEMLNALDINIMKE